MLQSRAANRRFCSQKFCSYYACRSQFASTALNTTTLCIAYFIVRKVLFSSINRLSVLVQSSDPLPGGWKDSSAKWVTYHVSTHSFRSTGKGWWRTPTSPMNCTACGEVSCAIYLPASVKCNLSSVGGRSYRNACVWNSLPDVTTSISLSVHFKRPLKTLLAKTEYVKIRARILKNRTRVRYTVHGQASL